MGPVARQGIIVSEVRWRDRRVRGLGPMERFPCGPARLNRPRVTEGSSSTVRKVPGQVPRSRG